MSQTLLIERDGAVAILTLNRPEKLNALSGELRRALHHALHDLDADESCGAIILTGAGDRAFTAGMDLKEAAERRGQLAAPDENPAAAIDQCRKPIIVAVNGLCITGGMEIMLACDIIIASTNAKFADTHVRVGLLPGWGISQRLSRQVGPQRAKEISLSGNFFEAQRAFDLGLINRVVEPHELMPAALALAHDFASANRKVMLEYKRLIDDGFEMELKDALALELERSRAFTQSLTPEDFTRGKEAASLRNRTQAGL
ncbi:enoyl-CoA hydratase [Phenylobacterium sp.]|uniref:enoyl-CoA hydratase n=1 Tax=Phenylobacterium sp. TaxID=1871053 RepID=UPI0027337B8F|nr:enoyl-CoA hydratase [Phenylobacterium sp.]MDP3659834.1 enoyl-CoA hydratase [Phenylobacterium sp.]